MDPKAGAGAEIKTARTAALKTAAFIKPSLRREKIKDMTDIPPSLIVLSIKPYFARRTSRATDG
jgi:hypothetical protein